VKSFIVSFFRLVAPLVDTSRAQQTNLYNGFGIESLYTMLVIACFLLGITIFFIILIIRLKKQNLNHQIALIEAEQKEAKLQLRLQEEQTVKTQLERYSVLSDFHLKEMELIGKSKEIEHLRKDKETLDKEVERYRQKVEAYEKMLEKEKDDNSDTLNVIVEDIRRLVNKQPPSDIHNDYLHQISRINKSFIEFLRDKSDDSLSISYLKYCVCFAIGMSISDVTKFFCIEQSSVHMIRYRLRKKIRIGNDDDLDMFIQKYAFQ